MTTVMDARAEEFIRANTRRARPPLVPEVELWLATELTPLWSATAALLEAYDPLPFWAFAWPGSQALARFLIDHPELVDGRRVLDFGGGSGLGAIGAMRAGARSALSSDLDPFCESAVAMNAELNGVPVSATSADLLGVELADVDLVLAGDIYYERETALAASRWFAALARRGVTVLVGDPGRLYSPTHGLEVLGRYEVPTSRELEDREVRATTVSRVLP
jgi:predicted nicotinamide N-methyase